MSSSDDFVLAQLRVLTDRAEVAQLCDRYVMHLDRDRDNDAWLSSVFTDDATLVFPTGTYQGLAGLAEFQQMGRENFESSHHISANHCIELDGDRALVRGHLIAVHIRRREEPGRHFDIGGHYDAEAVRTPGGWRFASFDCELAWTGGEVPAQVGAAR